MKHAFVIRLHSGVCVDVYHVHIVMLCLFTHTYQKSLSVHLSVHSKCLSHTHTHTHTDGRKCFWEIEKSDVRIEGCVRMRLGFDSSLTDFRFEMVYFVCVEHLKHSLFLSHARTRTLSWERHLVFIIGMNQTDQSSKGSSLFKVLLRF